MNGLVNFLSSAALALVLAIAVFQSAAVVKGECNTPELSNQAGQEGLPQFSHGCMNRVCCTPGLIVKQAITDGFCSQCTDFGRCLPATASNFTNYPNYDCNAYRKANQCVWSWGESF